MKSRYFFSSFFLAFYYSFCMEELENTQIRTNYSHLWYTSQDKICCKILNHDDMVSSIAISPNNEFLVSGSWDKTIKVWDLNSGNCILTLKGHEVAVTSVAISKDNKFIVSGSLDKTVKLWDFNSGDCIYTFTATNKYETHVNSVAISSDNEFIVSGNTCENTRAYINFWDSKLLLDKEFSNSSTKVPQNTRIKAHKFCGNISFYSDQ